MALAQWCGCYLLFPLANSPKTNVPNEGMILSVIQRIERNKEKIQVEELLLESIK